MMRLRLSAVLGAALALGSLAATAGAQRTGQVNRPLGTKGPVEADTIVVTARQTGPGEITVTWNAPPGATSYFLGRLAPPDGWRRVNSPTPSRTSYVDRDVQPGRTYRYQVSAIDRNGRAGPRFTSDSVVVRADVPASGGGGAVATGGGAPAETRAAMLERVYDMGAARERAWWSTGAHLAKRFWLAAADSSGFDEETLGRRWKEIAIAAQLYQHIFHRPPTALELRRQLAAQQAGVSHDDQWRQLAQSAQRERELGAWAPSPMTREQARGVFGWRGLRNGEHCFGGLGPGCAGGLPGIFGWAQPKWERHFKLPDGTEMAYVEVGVAVGSIMHDNACMDAPQGEGVACNGYVAIDDLTKHDGLPASMEWNKAGWNVIDGRGWRHTFGPYPVDPVKRHRWYDDLRVVPGRGGMMARSLGPISTPVQDQPYRGRERKQSRILGAPGGTTLDAGDASYCASGSFRARIAPQNKAPAGICADDGRKGASGKGSKG